MDNIHIIIGEDDFLVSEAAKKVVGGVEGTALEIFDSANDGNAADQLSALKRVEESVATPPFLDPVKVTWWKNVKFLPQAGKGAVSEDVKAALEKFATKLAATQIPDNQTLVITGPKLLKTSLFAKTLSKVAEFIYFAALKPWEQQRDAVVRAIDCAKEMGLTFDSVLAKSEVLSSLGPVITNV